MCRDVLLLRDGLRFAYFNGGAYFGRFWGRRGGYIIRADVTKFIKATTSPLTWSARRKFKPQLYAEFMSKSSFPSSNGEQPPITNVQASFSQ